MEENWEENLGFNKLVDILTNEFDAKKNEDSSYSVELENKGCKLNLNINEIGYILKLYFLESHKTFEGAVHPLTNFYLFNTLIALKQKPYVAISCFFGDGTEEKYPLSIYNERVMIGIIEWNFLLREILKVEDWDGSEFDLDVENAEITAIIDKTSIPYLLFYINKGPSFNVEIPYTLYDWVLDFKEEMSWVLYDRTTFKVADIPKEVPFIDYFKKVFEAYKVKYEGDIFRNLIELPIRNPYVLKSDFYMNHLGAVVRLFTVFRPDKPFLIKIPYRANVERELDIFNKFLYLLLSDPVGLYNSTPLAYFRYIDHLYMGLFIVDDYNGNVGKKDLT